MKKLLLISTIAFAFASCSTAKGATYGETGKHPPSIKKECIKTTDVNTIDAFFQVKAYVMDMAPSIKIATPIFILPKNPAPYLSTFEKPPLYHRQGERLCIITRRTILKNIEPIMRC